MEMQKTKMGISVGMLGAAIYLTGLFSGYLVTVLLVGYVLLVEDNPWLRRMSVRAITLMIIFSLLSTLVGLIPDLIAFVDSVFRVFNGIFAPMLLTNIVNVVLDALSVLRTVLFLLLGVKALSQSTIHIPVVDELVARYMDK